MPGRYNDPKLDDIADYYHALGQFVHFFAYVEANMFELLRLFSGTTKKVAPAILSGTRTDHAINSIRRLHEAHSRPLDPDLDSALGQLAVINGTRNDILHYGGFGSGEKRMVSTKRAAITKDRIRQFRISDSILLDMAGDLAFIVADLNTIRKRLPPWRKRPPIHYKTARTWIYKSPQPARDPGKPRGKPPKQQRPQKSSSA